MLSNQPKIGAHIFNRLGDIYRGHQEVSRKAREAVKRSLREDGWTVFSTDAEEAESRSMARLYYPTLATVRDIFSRDSREVADTLLNFLNTLAELGKTSKKCSISRTSMGIYIDMDWLYLAETLGFRVKFEGPRDGDAYTIKHQNILFDAFAHLESQGDWKVQLKNTAGESRGNVRFVLPNHN